MLPDRTLAYYMLDNVTRDWRTLCVKVTDSQIEEVDRIKWYRAEDMDEEYGIPDEHNPQFKILQVEWGHPEWRKDMAKLDKKQRDKEKRQQDRNIRGGGGGSNGEFIGAFVENSPKVQGEIAKIRTKLDRLYF